MNTESKMSDFTEIKERWKDTCAYKVSNIQTENDIDILIDIIEKQRGGLEFYGDEENYGASWDEDDEYQLAPIEEDEGKSARDLLKLTEE